MEEAALDMGSLKIGGRIAAGTGESADGEGRTAGTGGEAGGALGAAGQSNLVKRACPPAQAGMGDWAAARLPGAALRGAFAGEAAGP